MYRKKYRAGGYIESFEALEDIFKVSDFVMMDCGVRGNQRWVPKHKGFISSMPYHSVRSMLKSKGLAVAIKN